MKNQAEVIIKQSIIPELVSGSSTQAVTQRQALKTLKKFQGLSYCTMAHSFTARSVTPTLRAATYAGHSVRLGFTLIELLVVVLIIGILAAVAVPQYQKAVQKARLSEWSIYFSNYAKGIDSYLLANGYPDQTTDFTGNRMDDSYVYADLDIELPCESTTGDTCELKIGAFHVGCEDYGCWINFRTTGLTKYPVLAPGNVFYVNKRPTEFNGKWFVHTVPSDEKSRKLICQYWKENFGLEYMRETPKTACAEVGIH